MKKFLIIVSVIICLVLLADFMYYHWGFYIDFAPSKEVTAFAKTTEEKIYVKSQDHWQHFEIKGVNIGSGAPGEWASDYAITDEDYLRWFGLIQEMGANTVRVYSTQSESFYKAFYEYNTERRSLGKEPLWLIHGVALNDYAQQSYMNAYSDEFIDVFIEDCKTMVDVIHGRKKISLGRNGTESTGTYKTDISEWVLGYILGTEWEGDVVVYTNQLHEGETPYQGKYFYTTDSATPFENMLAKVGDTVMQYETDKYKNQRLISFANWCTTDPFKYSASVSLFWNKTAFVDVEHIKTTDALISGCFASYNALNTVELEKQFIESSPTEQQKADVTYLNMVHRLSKESAPTIDDYITEDDYYDKDGQFNAYKAYIIALNRYHTIPVVISEFGFSTGRGVSLSNTNIGGNLTEQQQGQRLTERYSDIKEAGSAGACVFSWHDEWFKRSWNTMYAVDLQRTPYWSDYQTSEQYFGFLAFDPGEEKSVCYVDGNISEWTDEDKVITGDTELSLKYDEKFMYFMVKKDNFDIENDNIYIPLDITPKSGSNYCINNGLKFERNVDFIIHINGKHSSSVKVQERYEALRSTYAQEVYQFDTYVNDNIPDKSSNEFKDISLVLRTQTFDAMISYSREAEVFDTGKLLYANANPKSPDFNSLGDFCHKGDYIEIRIPWQMLNFADPSQMQIHDDYYDGLYGVDFIKIDEMYAGVCSDTCQRIKMQRIELQGWGNDVTSHERLKKSYYILKEFWNK